MISQFIGEAPSTQQFFHQIDRAIGRGALVRYATQASPTWDRDDLIQDVAEALLRRGAKLDLSRGTPDDFIYMLARSRADHHVRALAAGFRDHSLEVRPEADPADGEADETFAFDKVTFEFTAHQHRDKVRQRELSEELDAAMAVLGPKDRGIFEALREYQTEAEVARVMGLTPPTVNDAVRRIRKVFERRGLGAYVQRKPGTPAGRAS